MCVNLCIVMFIHVRENWAQNPGKLGAKTGKLGANIILYSACKQLIFNTFREFFLTPVFRLIFFLDSLRESLKGKRLLSPLRGEAFFP